MQREQRSKMMMRRQDKQGYDAPDDFTILLVSIALRAVDMETAGKVVLPERTLEGEDSIALFCWSTVHGYEYAKRYQDNLFFDEFIEEALLNRYGVQNAGYQE